MAGENLGLFEAAELPIALKPPAYFKQLPQRLDTEFCCPRCAYGWAGKPKPTVEDAVAEVESDPTPEAVV